MYKVLLIANTQFNFWNFRKEIIKQHLTRGNKVCLLAPRNKKYQFKYESHENLSTISWDSKGVILDLIIGYSYVLRYKLYEINYIFSFTLYGNILTSLVAIHSKNFYWIANVTGLGRLYRGFWKKSFLSFYKKIVSSSDKLLLQNQRDFNLFNDHHNANIIFGSGINLNEFLPKVKLNSKVTRVCFIGRLIAQKGVYALCEAFLLQKNKTLELNIYGEGDTKKLKHIYGDRINFYGFHNNIKEVYSNNDAIIFPSSYAEGIPRVLIESCASSLIICPPSLLGMDMFQNNKKLILQTLNVDEIVRVFDCLSNLTELEIKNIHLHTLKLRDKLNVLQVLSYY